MAKASVLAEAKASVLVQAKASVLVEAKELSVAQDYTFYAVVRHQVGYLLQWLQNRPRGFVQ